MSTDGTAADDATLSTADGNGAPDSNQSVADTASIQQALQRKDEELKTANDRYLRAIADFDNVRKRLRQEQDTAIANANVDLITQLLPVLDNFDRALSHARESRDFDNLLQGVSQIYKQLNDTLAKQDVQPIDAIGQPFNPEVHEAIGQVPSDQYPEGAVAEVVRDGYRMKGRCIRPSLVRVAG